MAFKYEFERPGLTVDCVIFGLDLEEETLRVMLNVTLNHLRVFGPFPAASYIAVRR
jgi:hypothetical protein